MLSKEEIVRKHYEKMFSSQKYDASVNKKMNQEYFFPAMDEYAKQEAIGFDLWKREQGYTALPANKSLYRMIGKNQVKDYTVEQLFDKYLKAKPNATK